MTTLTICRGLPGSGKSTWALEQKAVRVNRDSIRAWLFGPIDQSYYSHPDLKAREEKVTEVSYRRIRLFLSEGLDVVCDDTNLPVRRCRELMRIAEEVGADWVEKQFDTPVDVCISRQPGRPKGEQVPELVIRRMAQQYLGSGFAPLPAVSGLNPKTHDYSMIVPVDREKSKGLPQAFIFDIDGTLAHMNGRGPHDYHLVHTDTVDESVWCVAWAINSMENPPEILVVSGRKASCQGATEAWLDNANVPFSDLYMRADGDDRTDWIVKYEIFNKHVRDKYDVVGVFDDRAQVVRMWRALGLKCFQVQEGDF